MNSRSLLIAPEVRSALQGGQPVVALESAVITHGLPREPLGSAPPCAADWEDDLPANLALAHLLVRTVRTAGAIPACVGMLDGTLIVGMGPEQLHALATHDSPRKLSSRDLGPAAAGRATGGTTVAGTLSACAAAGIRVFATGGIGGVHRGWSDRPDISADLHALARTPAAVVSSGAKAILDLTATVEALDTLGVPVLGFGTRFFPRFTAPGDHTLTVSATVPDADHAARACLSHWEFNPRGGVLIANPPPQEYAIMSEELETAVQTAQRAAADGRVTGEALTPFLLSHLAASTQGKAVHANIAVLQSNARLAAQIAARMPHANGAPST